MDDRAIDALIAIHLFKYERVEWYTQMSVVPRQGEPFMDYMAPWRLEAEHCTVIREGGIRELMHWQGWPGGHRVERVSYYDSTWEGAGLVVEAMRARGFAFALQGSQEAEPEWLARLGDKHAYADTMPRAVCLAALAALGVEIGEGVVGSS